MIAAVIDLAAERMRRKPLRCRHCGGEIQSAAGVCERGACLLLHPEARRAWLGRAQQRLIEVAAKGRA